MFRSMLKSKIHRAVVTESNLNYIGSITIDEDLMEAADILENRWRLLISITGSFDTYVIIASGFRGDVFEWSRCQAGTKRRYNHHTHLQHFLGRVPAAHQ